MRMVLVRGLAVVVDGDAVHEETAGGRRMVCMPRLCRGRPISGVRSMCRGLHHCELDKLLRRCTDCSTRRARARDLMSSGRGRDWVTMTSGGCG